MRAQVNDAKLWAGLEVEVGFGKKLELNFNDEIRFGQNISMFEKHLSEVGAMYKFNKWLQAGLGYRFSEENYYNEYISFEHRLTADLKAKFKLDKFSFSYKNTLIFNYSQIFSSEDGTTPSVYNRGKLQVKYHLNRRMEAMVFHESFIPLNGKRSLGIDENRIGLGLEYSLYKWLTIKPYYLISLERNRNNPEHKYISGLTVKIGI